MNTAPPDYASCSLRELYQVLNHIDKDRVPDTYVALVEEIESREPRDVRELLDCWRNLNRAEHPQFAEKLAAQIHALEST
ncbi:MAG: hypothetical protein AAFY69_10610 [Pseudomonadota bacterium]